MTKRINGIQQLGVGVEELRSAFNWYRQYLGMDVRMFEEKAVAELMLPHTGGKTRERHALLALNMEGGGGFEIWQHTGKKPEPAKELLQLGDWGINIGKLKTTNVHRAYERFKAQGLDLLTKPCTDPAGRWHFYLRDPYSNSWEVMEHPFALFPQQQQANGGVSGAVIGVKDIDESLRVYRDILGYDQLIYDQRGSFDDWQGLPGAEGQFRRLLLTHSKLYRGSFSPFLGPSYIELIQSLDRQGRSVFEWRIWGDPGFMHLCYDINGMDELRDEVSQKGFPFTVDSARATESFDMGEAAGNFSYIQAPEGTLIEFVETHKIPLLKKIGWYLNLRKRGERPLPRLLLRFFGFMRVK